MSDISNMEKIRKEKNMTQEQVANAVHVARSTYVAWSKGSPVPSDKLTALARLFDCSTDYLLGLTDCRSVDNDYISRKTGLSEESIEYLTKCQTVTNNNKLLRDAAHKNRLMMKTSFGDDSPVADTVNFLLSPENTKRGTGGLIDLIHQYLTIPNNISLSDTDEGKYITLRGITGFHMSTSDLIYGGLLGMIQTRLIQDRDRFRKKKH